MAQQPLVRSSPAALNEKIDALGQAWLETHRAPGFSVAVVREGRLVYARGFGYSDLSAKLPAHARTVYAIGSITKTFTAAAVLKLAQEHKLSLDDRLAAYLPHFTHADEITLRQLLNHTSGLPDFPTALQAWRLNRDTGGRVRTDDIIRMLDGPALDFVPGTQWEYSNSNYVVLAAVIAKVSHSSYGAFVGRTIFEPLRLTDTSYGEPARRAANMAVAYRSILGLNVRQRKVSLDTYSGAGGITSTAPDLARFDDALMAGNIVSKKSFHIMYAPARLADGHATHYGMGLAPDELYGDLMLWHNGLAPGAGGYCLNVFPAKRLAIAVLSNGYDFQSTGLVKKLYALYYP